MFEMHNLAEELSLLGHQVYAIDYRNRWKRNSLFDLGSLKTTVISPVARAYPDALVTLIRPGFIKVKGLSRLSAAFTHFTEIRKTIEHKKIDVIVLYSVATNGLQTIFLAKRFNIPIVFRSIDILNQLVPYKPLRLPTKMLERKIYSHVDLILTITHTLSDYVRSMGAKSEKVKLLPLLVDTHLFHPTVDPLFLREKWKLPSHKKVILYMGMLHSFSGLDEVIRQFPEVINTIPEACLLIVGDGPKRTELEDLITELNLNNHVIVTGLQPYNTMPAYINLSTICISPFQLTNATKDIFPSKIVQYLACSKPVISTPLPGVTAMIAGEEQGIVYATDAQQIAEEITLLFQSPARCKKIGQAGLLYAKETNGHESIARKLEDWLQKAIAEKRSTKKTKKV